MIHSMTGYGREQIQVGNKTISVEIRSLNSKGIDLNLKLPSQYREKELDARNMVSAHLERGKIDAYINIQGTGDASFEINKEAVKKYYTQVLEVYNELGHKVEADTLASIFRFPEAISSGSQELDENEWKQVVDSINKACNKLKEFRAQEGKKLEADMRTQVGNILSNLKAVNQYEAERMQTVKDRLIKNLNELGLKENFDKNRFEQELIYYLEKLDVNEEKVRLTGHCEYFLKTMETEAMPGRKLGFISQEMGREINTLGSKCNHAEIQKLVVKMKDDLEKIKEQCLNIL
ncbi:MAG TPA: YicC/YloC family endoribonuclease [Flavobacteriales bacterium]|nr:YicC/YloC family endoribonuclease [Flavobacteriales bacterium]